MGFASLMNISKWAMALSQNHYNNGIVRIGAKMALSTSRADAKIYMIVELPSFREAYIKAMAVGLEGANAILPSPLIP